MARTDSLCDPATRTPPARCPRFNAISYWASCSSANSYSTGYRTRIVSDSGWIATFNLLHYIYAQCNTSDDRQSAQRASHYRHRSTNGNRKYRSPTDYSCSDGTDCRTLEEATNNLRRVVWGVIWVIFL